MTFHNNLACEQALLFGQVKRAARFARPNRRACSQAIITWRSHGKAVQGLNGVMIIIFGKITSLVVNIALFIQGLFDFCVPFHLGV